MTTAATSGHSPTSNLGPTDGNRFDERFDGDLALLASLGVTDVRYTFDWARLQPAPDRLDELWAEHIDEVLVAAHEHGLRIWATLHDGAAPRWIDDEGGTGDARTLTRWWPHWVERVAERWGDRVHGWIPFAAIAADMPMRPWLDTWGILRGSADHVIASTSTANLDQSERFQGTCHGIGIALHAPDENADELSPEPSDGELDRLAERLLRDTHRCAENADGIEVVVSQFTAHHADADIAGAFMKSMVQAADEAVADGIELSAVFADPAVQISASSPGLLDIDRAPLPAGSAFFTPDVE